MGWNLKESLDAWNKLPADIIIPKHCLETTIVVHMSEGMPKAYLQALELRTGEKEHNWLSICEPGSPMAKEKVSPHLVDWCRKINILINENAEIFQDAAYWETAGDRRDAAQARAAVPFDQIGVPKMPDFENED